MGDQETGLLTETTPEAMAHATISLLSENNLRKRLLNCV